MFNYVVLIAFLSLMRYTLIYLLFPVKSSLRIKTLYFTSLLNAMFVFNKLFFQEIVDTLFQTMKRKS
ncbi:hypothetical protein CBP19_22480 [Fischerella thermalis WC1110]|nr:hypothetical protein CBP19_22480 [Fischerella thermalis WC1110]PLZ40504.1 hypothetical protein CBP25_19235 [Fischerella thermalis WC527]